MSRRNRQNASGTPRNGTGAFLLSQTSYNESTRSSRSKPKRGERIPDTSIRVIVGQTLPKDHPMEFNIGPSGLSAGAPDCTRCTPGFSGEHSVEQTTLTIDRGQESLLLLRDSSMELVHFLTLYFYSFVSLRGSKTKRQYRMAQNTEKQNFLWNSAITAEFYPYSAANKTNMVIEGSANRAKCNEADTIVTISRDSRLRQMRPQREPCRLAAHHDEEEQGRL